jgi:hypothetical protein
MTTAVTLADSFATISMPGQLVVVPRGIEHRTGSDEECEVMIFEPSGVVNTADAPRSELTAPRTVVQ